MTLDVTIPKEGTTAAVRRAIHWTPTVTPVQVYSYNTIRKSYVQ